MVHTQLIQHNFTMLAFYKILFNSARLYVKKYIVILTCHELNLISESN